MNPLILTDTASDIPVSTENENLRVLPMKIFFGDTEYLDTVTLSHEEFYHKLIESAALPNEGRIEAAMLHALDLAPRD